MDATVCIFTEYTHIPSHTHQYLYLFLSTYYSSMPRCHVQISSVTSPVEWQHAIFVGLAREQLMFSGCAWNSNTTPVIAEQSTSWTFSDFGGIC